MKLVSKREIPKEICYDLSVQKNHNFFANGLCVHNTNAAVGIDNNCGMWCQSRENIITPEHDNAGFAMFAHGNKDIFQNISTKVVEQYLHTNITTHDKDVLIFGEWCGGNIQKGVAISGLPKMFVIFGIALVDAEENKTYLTREQVEAVTVGLNPSHAGQIFSIYNFQTYAMVIDFNKPEMSQNNLNDITLAVETRCPVGHAMGQDGIGEGVVWRCVNEGYNDSGFWFKVKGEAHSASKVKTLATVDVERINNINELAQKLANNGRLEQMLQQVFNTLNGGEPDVKGIGEFIKAMMQDIFKEELDTIAASGYTGKELNGPVSKICRDFVMAKLVL